MFVGHYAAALTLKGKEKGISVGMLLRTTQFVAFLVLVNYLNLFVLPANEDINSLTISALFFYFLFAGIAHFVDKTKN
jgi:hypothetical protein